MKFYEPRDETRMSEDVLADRITPTSEVYRDRFHEDVGRLVHSQSYRRLARKRQLLPNENSDFVRTRLTHSCEVAQVATSLGAWLNRQHKLAPGINADLLVYAGLAHDLGHPPFGHLGERTLNERMWDAGGFEGNAQTLRILTTLERRLTKGQLEADEDGFATTVTPHGINSTMRAIASTLKYDAEIPVHQPEKIPRRRRAELIKGYYHTESDTVARLKDVLAPGREFDERTSHMNEFKTIEAQVMDYADDIAYSIYDLEDCFKTGILSLSDFLTVDTDLLEQIGEEMAYKLTVDQFKRAFRTDSIDHKNPTTYDGDRVEEDSSFVEKKSFNTKILNPGFLSRLIYSIFKPVFPEVDATDPRSGPGNRLSDMSASALRRMEGLQFDDAFRRKFTEQFIGNCIRSCSLELNADYPALSTIIINRLEYLQIELLKRFNFHKVIKSELIQSSDSRNAQVIRDVFDALYLPGDEFKNEASLVTGYPLVSGEFRRRFQEIYSENPISCDDLLLGFERNHIASPNDNPTLPSYYTLDYMLDFRRYGFRFELSEAIHKFARFSHFKLNSGYTNAAERRVKIKRLVCDFIASLTDRGLLELHERIHREDRRIVIDDFAI